MFENYQITLASASPRRRELLSNLDIRFNVEPNKNQDESYPENTIWSEIPLCLARYKSEIFHRELAPNEILITADTLVFNRASNGEMVALGKPTSIQDAKDMLRSLSGHSHYVLTGVCLRTIDREEAFTSTTEVTFRDLTEEEINYYVDTYKPLDKAGAYGVQEWIGHVAISSINGSYFNVVGLPVAKLYEALCSITK
jgi:septum formation protein